LGAAGVQRHAAQGVVPTALAKQSHQVEAQAQALGIPGQLAHRHAGLLILIVTALPEGRQRQAHGHAGLQFIQALDLHIEGMVHGAVIAQASSVVVQLQRTDIAAGAPSAFQIALPE